MRTESHIAEERFELSRPLNEDVMYVYKVRYTCVRTFADDDTLMETQYISEYGGVGGGWTRYEPFEKLDFENEGVLALDGLLWNNFRGLATTIDEIKESQLRTLYEDLAQHFGGAFVHQFKFMSGAKDIAAPVEDEICEICGGLYLYHRYGIGHAR